MEAKEDVTDQSSINDTTAQKELVAFAPPPKTLTFYPPDIIDKLVNFSAFYKAQHRRNGDHNLLVAFRGNSKVVENTKVAQIKLAIDNWFSMYYYYHSNQKLVNEQYFFNNSWFQPWHPLQISINQRNVLIRLWYLPKNQNFEPYCVSATLNATTPLLKVAESPSAAKTQLPWRCRSQRRTFDHAFKFFQNYSLHRGQQKTLVFKNRDSCDLNGKHDLRNDPKPKDHLEYKYAQNLNNSNSISRRAPVQVNHRANCMRNRSGENPYYELCDNCTQTYKAGEAKPRRQPRSFMNGDDLRNDLKPQSYNYSNLLKKQTFKIDPGRKYNTECYQQPENTSCGAGSKSKSDVNMRKHPVQLLCELYGKNGLQIECEFICNTPFRKQKVTYTVMGRKFTAVSHTRDEAKRLCAKKVLTTLHPELHHELQEEIPKREYDFGYRLNRRHPVDLVNYFFKNEAVLIETERKGLSHFTSYTVHYIVRGRKYLASAEKQNEAKRRCAILVLNDFYRSNDHYK